MLYQFQPPYQKPMRTARISIPLLAALLALAPVRDSRAQLESDPNSITIVCSGGAEVNQKSNTMIYLKDVVFKHPQQRLTITCDRLEVIREDPPPRPPPRPLEEEAAQDVQEPEPDEGEPDIKQAIATGNVIITMMNAEGKPRVATGKRAVYEGREAEVHLFGSPTLDVGNLIFNAASENTVIILVEDGNHRFIGPIRTIAQPADRKPGAPRR